MVWVEGCLWRWSFDMASVLVMVHAFGGRHGVYGGGGGGGGWWWCRWLSVVVGGCRWLSVVVGGGCACMWWWWWMVVDGGASRGGCDGGDGDDRGDCYDHDNGHD